MKQLLFLFWLTSLSNAQLLGAYVPNPDPTLEPHGCPNHAPCADPQPYSYTPIFLGVTVGSTICPSGKCVCNNGTSPPGTCNTVDNMCTPNPCPTTSGQNWACQQTTGVQRCICASGWSGTNCDKDLSNPCTTNNPCNNGGTCSKSGSNDYTCTCTNDWFGPQCQYKKCQTTSCKNGGTCGYYDSNLLYCTCATNYIGDKCETFSNSTAKPCTSTSCGGTSKGLCIKTSDIGYDCLCKEAYTGSSCGSVKSGPCTSTSCSNGGTCVPDKAQVSYTCACPSTYYGDKCEHEKCVSLSDCKNGGSCVDKPDGSYTCACMEWYYGTKCENANRCNYANPCINGTCIPNVQTTNPYTYTCKCDPGFTGDLCEEIINNCVPTPCKYNTTCTNKLLDYSCACPVGLSGKDCGINLPDCLATIVNGVNYKDQCSTKDKNAVCNDLINAYTCNCSSQYVGDLCQYNKVIFEVMMQIYGEVNLQLLPVLTDLLQNPAAIKDMVPFIVGLLDSANRTDLSWSVEDIFYWFTFEERRVNLETDIVRWNDVVLGNCFTFNHKTSNHTFQARNMASAGGARGLLRVRQDEYVPWVDTAAISVFVHEQLENIFSESVRYNAKPGGETIFDVSETHYTRLAGNYGKCVDKASQVKAYYYDGMYTTDGCLRSCYQDMIYEKCGCMDPRYPMRHNTSSCKMTERTCIDTSTASEGDPSSWPSCVCPLPCNNKQFMVSWSQMPFASPPSSCADCIQQDDDSVYISINLPELDYDIFRETPAMDFNKFISYLGGLLGVLMGISISSFIEFTFLIARLGIIMVSGKG